VTPVISSFADGKWLCAQTAEGHCKLSVHIFCVRRIGDGSGIADSKEVTTGSQNPVLKIEPAVHRGICRYRKTSAVI
jgi:hypothetical protein